MSLNLGLIDYGMGNLHSVEKCLERLDQRCSLIQHAEDLDGIDALILPGVGAFDPAMANLRASPLPSGPVPPRIAIVDATIKPLVFRSD